MKSRGISDAYILGGRFSIQKYHAEVYLMTETEIRAFFETCDKYVLRHKAVGRPYVFPALYRFMYCCGVRSIETRRLKCTDVHLGDKDIDIIQSKAIETGGSFYQII